MRRAATKAMYGSTEQTSGLPGALVAQRSRYRLVLLGDKGKQERR